METITMLIGKIGRYLSLLRIADLVDVAIIAFLVYQLLNLVKSTRSANILKGVGIFLVRYCRAMHILIDATYYIKNIGRLQQKNIVPNVNF